MKKMNKQQLNYLKLLVALNILTLLIISILLSKSLSGQNPYIKISPESASVGGDVLIEWNSQTLDKVFISHLGILDSFGQIIIKAKETKKYSLVFEKNGQMIVLEKTLTVGGIKGFDDYPDQNRFISFKLLKIESESLNYLIDKIYRVLQDIMYFNVRMPPSSLNVILFVTNLKEESSLKDISEKRIDKRRLSYMIELSKIKDGQNKYECKVYVQIEYKNKIERVWRKELDEDLYHEQLELLMNKIR